MQHNNTDDGLFTIKTGSDDYKDFARILEWKNSSHLKYWDGGPESYCIIKFIYEIIMKKKLIINTNAGNSIQGTDGTVFPYDLNLNERIYIYQTDLCRYLIQICKFRIFFLNNNYNYNNNDKNRTVYVTYANDEKSHGLPGKKFVLPKSVLASPAEAEENACFCKADQPESCYGTGLTNMGACYIGRLYQLPITVWWYIDVPIFF